MPQLDPSTWMPTFLLSWLAFLTTITQKVEAHTFTNNPAPIVLEDEKKGEWNWTW
nr:ATP synthase F0 subunit 8 [Ulaema lefroyi]